MTAIKKDAIKKRALTDAFQTIFVVILFSLLLIINANAAQDFIIENRCSFNYSIGTYELDSGFFSSGGNTNDG